MGLEQKCSAVIARKRHAGTAFLETEEIRFRGESRLVIPFQEIRSATAQGGTLVVVHSGGTARFELGPHAAKWAERIKNPRSLLDKLGVKPGQDVAVVAIDDGAFLERLAGRVDVAASAGSRANRDLVFLGLAGKPDLKRLATLRKAIAPNGAIWAVWPKGRPELREDDIRAAAIAAGLVDVKVAAFSQTHSALKLVIPLAKR